jgi:hypothetical protein
MVTEIVYDYFQDDYLLTSPLASDRADPAGKSTFSETRNKTPTNDTVKQPTQKQPDAQQQMRKEMADKLAAAALRSVYYPISEMMHHTS